MPSLQYFSHQNGEILFICVEGLWKISVDCVMSEWSEWSLTCCPRGFGNRRRIRTRDVVTPPSNGGRECGETEQSNWGPWPGRDCIPCSSSCTDKLGKWRCKQMEHKCMDEKHKPSLMKNCGETCCKDWTKDRYNCFSCRNKAGRKSIHD